MKVAGVSAEVSPSAQIFWMHVVTADGQPQQVRVTDGQFEELAALLQVPARVPDAAAHYQGEVFATPAPPQVVSPRQPAGFEAVAEVLKQQAQPSEFNSDDGGPVDHGEVPLRGGLGNVPQF